MQRFIRHPVVRTFLSLLLYIGIYYFLFHDLKSILLLVVVIVIHEAGHFIAMKSYGYGNVRMLFVPLLGAFVSGQPARIDPVRKMVVLMAGPLPGILIGMICGMIYSHNHEYILYQLALLFIFLNVLNLLPVSPLDGGQMLETLFFSSKKWIQSIFILLSAAIIALLAWRTKNYALLLIDAFLLMRLSMIWKKEIDEEVAVSETEGGVDLGNNVKATFCLLWLLSMVMPMLTLVRIIYSK